MFSNIHVKRVEVRNALKKKFRVIIIIIIALVLQIGFALLRFVID